MAELAKSDIFFLITSAAIVVISIIIAVLLIYVFLIIRNVKKVVDNVKEESVALLDDVKELRVKLKSDESAVRRASSLFVFFRGLFFGTRKRRRKED